MLLCSFSTAQTIPPLPKYYVLDEASLLTETEKQALGSILVEHDLATGEQVAIAIFSETQGPASNFAHQVFETWAVGKRGSDNGALIVVDWKRKQARLIHGYGLEGRLNDADANRIVDNVIERELHAVTEDPEGGHGFRAIGLGLLDLLRKTESPLIESGRAEQYMRAGGMKGAFRPVPKHAENGPWWLWLFFGTGILSYFAYYIVSADAHFTSSGWFKCKPWQDPRAVIRSWQRNAPLGGVSSDW